MRRFSSVVLVALLWLQAAVAGRAEEFKLTNGELLKGEPASVTADGMVVRLDLGGFSERTGWGRFSQESLKSLLERYAGQAQQTSNQTARVQAAANLTFIEPFIEIPIEIKQKERAKKKEIILRDVPRLERPAVRPKFFSGMMAPAGMAMLILLYLANLYAAFEIAVFRHRPVPLVCGLSALFPVLGPVLFLLVPDGQQPAHAADEPAIAGQQEVVSAENKVAGMQSGLGLAQHQKPGKPEGSGAQTYKRTNTTFDRRFFESKFTPFFRIVPEGDNVIVIKTAKSEFIGRRISRISASEIHVQLLRGNTEVGVQFGEIAEVQVRHKDAKA